MLSWVGVKSCLLEAVFCKSWSCLRIDLCGFVADSNHQCGWEQEWSQCDTFPCWWLSHFLGCLFYVGMSKLVKGL